MAERSLLGAFAVFYGLDWIATVPPTVKLTTDAFGRENTGVVYGWIGASHQLGASFAAFGAGAIRTEFGGYRVASLVAGVLCLVAGASFLVVGRALRPQALQLRPAPGGASWRAGHEPSRNAQVTVETPRTLAGPMHRRRYLVVFPWR